MSSLTDRLKTGLLRLESNLVDRWMGVSTGRTVRFAGARGKHGDAFDFEPVSHFVLSRLFDRVGLASDDVALVLGCGKGRTVCHLARRPMEKVIGFEIDPQLAEQAEANARSLRGRRTPIEIRCADVAQADLSDGTFFFLFNPFGEETMQAVLAQLAQIDAGRTRTLRLVYLNALFPQVFDDHPWLEVEDDFLRRNGHRVMVMRSRRG